MRGRGIRSALAQVIATLRHMKHVIDHAAGEEPVSLSIEIESPWIARPLGEQLKLFRLRMPTKDRAREIKSLSIVNDLGAIKNSIHSVEPSVRAPRQAVGEFVAIASTKTGKNHFRFAGF